MVALEPLSCLLVEEHQLARSLNPSDEVSGSDEGRMDRLPNRRRHGRWEGIADLTVSRGLAADQLPGIGEALEPRHHRHGEPWKVPDERSVESWRLVSDTESIHAEPPPLPLRTRWTEVRATMPERATDDRGSDASCLSRPCASSGPAAPGHQVANRLTYRGRLANRLRPPKAIPVAAPESHQDEPWAQLRDGVPRCVENPPLGYVPQPIQLGKKLSTVPSKSVTSEAADVLKHHGRRPSFPDQPERFREEIALVVPSELLARDRERRTRDSACDQRYAAKVTAVDLAYVTVDHMPPRPVPLQRGARVPIDFHGPNVDEPGRLEAQRLAACAGADLQNRQLIVVPHIRLTGK